MQKQATLLHFTKHTTPKEVDISTYTSKGCVWDLAKLIGYISSSSSSS
jgi:hypothetical protein